MSAPPVSDLLALGRDERWHVPANDVRGLCGADLVPDDTLSFGEVPEEERCRAEACLRVWSPRWSGEGAVPRPAPGRRERADGGPLDERAPLDDMDLDGDDRPLNPVETEAGIRKVARMVHRGVRVVSDSEQEFRAADSAYDRAYAAAYLDADGAIHAKRYAAELATQAERDRRDVAELAFKHADRRQRSLLAQLDAVRSVNASVRAMYAAESGVGR